MAAPITYEQFNIPCEDGSVMFVRLGELERETIRADRPHAETHVELGLKVFWQKDATAEPECAAEYWSDFYFRPSRESAIAQWLRQWERITVEESPTLDDFREALESYLATDGDQSAPLRPPLSGTPPPSPPTQPHEHSVMTDHPVSPATEEGRPAFIRRLEPVEVSISEDGFITLSAGPVEGAAVLKIHPSQADLVCRWIQEAKSNLE